MTGQTSVRSHQLPPGTAEDAARLVDPGKLLFQLVPRPDIIGIQVGNILAACKQRPAVARLCHAQTLFIPIEMNPCIFLVPILHTFDVIC